ncbi:MAG: SDR family oxidoreductase [Sphingomonas sp.]|uniref:SDR family NAD(P)-dependent oxidoreductase n=1 Tax=Sphingomonas sp. TaxID=28214 RepID=UPI0017912947|nr:2,5-dichloro-2,5-cyclohexadiene-1,4-diol dehydrogenase [Zymomonas sp.]MBA4041296.1 2,5-dichloro-2,5-cyclohexadiene-1,4-diol dehydrogenase [Sphingobium sp.]MBA4772637.1 SDR family oxidoreductase [Sphingomonas sp.]
MRFAGKRAVVTGGASGIGQATALRLVREGAEVLIGDIDEAGGREIAATSNGRITFQRCNVCEAGDIESLIHTADAAGGIDVLFNNAGAGGARARIDEISPDEWDFTQDLLLRSVALGIRYAAPLMARNNEGRGGGAIVNTASIAALGTGAAPTAYSVAKAGVLHLTHMAAADLARHNIRVNAVCPGFITTNIFTAAMEIDGQARDQANAAITGIAASAQPIQRPGSPDDIAAAVAYLASEDAAFVTGTHIVVDGGMTLGPRHSWDPNVPSLFAMLEAFKK